MDSRNLMILCSRCGFDVGHSVLFEVPQWEWGLKRDSEYLSLMWKPSLEHRIRWGENMWLCGKWLL